MKQYHVYVIELDSVVADKRKFRAKNPKYIKGNSCVYVGQSARKPALRFEGGLPGQRPHEVLHARPHEVLLHIIIYMIKIY